MIRKGAAWGEESTMLGIDVSKHQLSYALLDPTSRQVCGEGTVTNDRTGIAYLLAVTSPTIAWVVEPTGRYSNGVVRQATAAGRQVLLAPPRSAHAFLRSVAPRAKTDTLDGRGLAQYALAVTLRPYPVKSDLVDTLSQLLAARKSLSRSLATFRQQRQELPSAAEPLAATITALEAQQRALDRQLRQVVGASELTADVARLEAVPGIGLVTATAVAVCLSSKQFSHPDQFVAYVGLDVRVRDSGQRQGRRVVSRQGDEELRRLLYCCAQANLRSRDPANPFKAQYERERAKGLASTAALCVVARKLARTCWSLVAHETTYDPERVHRQG